MRRAKIVATVGPASDSPEVLDAMVRAGMRVARLNASHGDHASLISRLRAVREAGLRCDCHVAVMLDLGGPKLRVGDVRPGTRLETGNPFDIIVGDCPGDHERACVTHDALARDVSEGDRILLDDGRIALRVESTDGTSVRTTVTAGGELASRKGINVPGVSLSLDAITPKDLRDLAWGLDAGVDLVAQSFVRSAQDVERLRSAMADRVVPIVAKVEKHEAVARMDEIVAAADAVMVARGDLAVETSTEQVPVTQRSLIQACRNAGKPVVIATQMLESMIGAVRPTRAEASDVANAVFDHADAVMLSGETAIGSYPVDAVTTMASIVSAAEESMAPDFGHMEVKGLFDDVTDAVSDAVFELSSNLDVKAILCSTKSGTTARAVASKRPSTQVIAVTGDPEVARGLMVVWGVEPIVLSPAPTVEEGFLNAAEAARARGIVSSGDLVVFTAGAVVNVPGQTNLIEVDRVP